ncbi:MAG TPA: hypothetical protein VFK38_11155 [Candidatus Limnocylindrales bacterium]|nr:hypothetical protein [Candidatus Limnocylindrales bacterium]
MDTNQTDPTQPAPLLAPDKGKATTPDPPTAQGRTHERTRRERLRSLVLPVLLAALGLSGALIAWRTATANEAAAAETAAGVAAERAKSRAIVVAEGEVARTLEAWLDYERDRREAQALTAHGYPAEALREWSSSASVFFLVDPRYLDIDGHYDPQRHRDGLMADAASREDFDPLPHYVAADAEHERVRRLVLAGLLVAAALPLLTLAELTRGRVHRLGALAGLAVFASGLVLAGLVWL